MPQAERPLVLIVIVLSLCHVIVAHPEQPDQAVTGGRNSRQHSGRGADTSQDAGKQSREGVESEPDLQPKNLLDISELRGELLISVPISVILPTLTLRKGSPDSGKKAYKSHRRYHQVAPGGRRKSLGYIFKVLGIDDPNCRQKFVCQILKVPKSYSPISNIVYLVLRSDPTSEYHRAFEVGQSRGQNGTRCESTFHTCQTEPTANIDQNILSYWQELSHKMSLTITV